MMRLALSAAALALAALPVLAAPGAATAAPLAAPATVPEATAAWCEDGDDGDFVFDSYDADFFLGVDDAGRSTLTTVETFVARFPDIDQNEGMRRAIPLSYRGAPTDVAVVSVTDADGVPRPYTTEEDEDGEFLLVTSRAGECVHGAQTYVFTYTQHNVTRFFANTDADELFWDTNGTGWDQPFLAATSRVHVPPALAASLSGDAACYRGPEGSRDPCSMERADSGDGVVFSTAAEQLGPRENVTVAIAFQPHTFVPRDDSYWGAPLAYLQLLAVAGALQAAAGALVLRRTALADGRGRPTVIAEYEPPAGLDLFTASVLLGKTDRAAAAAFLDLAVRRAIRIVERPASGLFGKDGYAFELVDASGLEGPELELARALFGPELPPGAVYEMTGKDTALSAKVRELVTTAKAGATAGGLRKKGGGRLAAAPLLLVFASAGVSFFAGVRVIEDARGGAVPWILLAVPVLLGIVVIGLVSRIPLTAAGARLRDHLAGLELYIRLAEADRLRMLQSPTGAQREGEVLRVYERLLPYAVLFSLEKQWADELGRYYVEQAPDYYSGSGTFSAAVFAGSVGALSSTAVSSFSGSASSSSSGGSGGGGSSGGGGGGGGGGGV